MQKSHAIDTSELSVLHVIASDERRGAEVFASELVRSLAGELPGSLVALRRASGGDRVGATVVGERWYGLKTLRRLRKAMRESAAVVAHGSVTLPATVIAGFGLKTPIVYKNIGDPWFWSNSLRRRWQTIVLLRRVRYVAALTESSAEAARSCWKVPPRRVVVTGGGRDAAEFWPATQSERETARHELGLDPADRVVLFAGALSAEKRPDLAIAAATLIPDAVLLIAGDGPLRDRVERLAEASSTQVRVLGRRSDIHRLLHAADGLILTSASEGLPGVLIEAGLAGLPVVATDVGYVRDVVKHGVTGFIVDSAEPGPLADSLHIALSHRNEMGVEARSWCKENFDISVTHTRWLALLRRVVDGG